MSPSDSDLLRHMLDEADYLIGQRAVTTREDFLTNATLQRAFSRSIEILGEAVKQLSSETRDAHPDIPWKAIAGMRDRLIHGYFAVDYEIVWDVVENKIDDIRQRIGVLIGTDAS
jgi:uncharacterized protein with HEPN domain